MGDIFIKRYKFASKWTEFSNVITQKTIVVLSVMYGLATHALVFFTPPNNVYAQQEASEVKQVIQSTSLSLADFLHTSLSCCQMEKQSFEV